MKLVSQLNSKKGVGKRVNRTRNAIKTSNNITRKHCSLFDQKNGQSKVTIDLSFTPSGEVQRIQLKELFADDEFQRQSAFYKYYKIDIVNAMFFANSANGQVFVNYAAPNDNLISIDNDFSRVISYPMYKIKSVIFTHINTRKSTGDGVFVFNQWNSSQVIPDNIGDLIIYNRNQITFNLRVRIVIRFRGYTGENVLPTKDIPILKEDKKFRDIIIQTEEVKIEDKKIEEDKKENLRDKGEQLYEELKNLCGRVKDKYPIYTGEQFFKSYEEIMDCPEHVELQKYIDIFNKEHDRIAYKEQFVSEDDKENELFNLENTLWARKMRDIQKHFDIIVQQTFKFQEEAKGKKIKDRPK